MAQYAKDEYLKGNAKAKGMGEREQVLESLKPRTKKPKGMVSMKRSAKEKKANKAELSSPSEDQFPYGLGLHIDDDSMEKLGGDVPAAGKTVHIHAKAKVTRSEVNNDERGTRKSAHLQITHMKMSHSPINDDEGE